MLGGDKFDTRSSTKREMEHSNDILDKRSIQLGTSLKPPTFSEDEKSREITTFPSPLMEPSPRLSK